MILLVGKTSGKLTVVYFHGKSKQGNQWLCKCSCGNSVIVSTRDMNSHNKKSCGCLKAEVLLNRNKEMSTHNKTNTRLFRIWKGMKFRCYNPNSKDYSRYGARGITVCKEWLDAFINFYNWSMENGYKENLTIDRIDNDGNYEPSNCRWVTIKEQLNNTGNNYLITLDGKTLTASEWSDILGISSKTLIYRDKRNWSSEDMIRQPNRGNRYAR